MEWELELEWEQERELEWERELELEWGQERERLGCSGWYLSRS